ncbi:hypothetical protein [Peredibacter starrii]|uniref:Lipoprotein n=1 Tax=Peredibacter starrii TaxID=28202 RepID=A0AAX4HUV1_9BACT|nr:hypothetical protein [Peredibacter starrii]WPU67064.1 hypothetical protein SOO65_09895 [Peredibacter starrii]
MTKIVAFGLLLTIASCSNLPFGKRPAPTQPKVAVTPVEPARTKPEVKGPTAVWYLHSHDRVTLYLRNVDDTSSASMILEKGLNRFPIPEGHWELTGFEEADRSFTSMNTSKKFVFRVRPRSTTYAGSIVIGCPKVQSDDFKFLKPMKFFDRYPFSSEVGLCEMIVGNDFASVKTEFKKAHKTKGLNLTIGF